MDQQVCFEDFVSIESLSSKISASSNSSSRSIQPSVGNISSLTVNLKSSHP